MTESMMVRTLRGELARTKEERNKLLHRVGVLLVDLARLSQEVTNLNLKVAGKPDWIQEYHDYSDTTEGER